MNSNTILALKDIVKTFPGVRALNGVSMDIKKGEVHALCGENGAGKSTLMKIISGAQEYSSGTMIFKGSKKRYKNTKEAEFDGISMIYQEFNMINDMSIAENLYLGRYPMRGPFIDYQKLYFSTEKILKELKLVLNPKEKIKNLSVAEIQMCEIAKAISTGSELIIMDEPTAALTKEESEILFELIAKFKEKGISIIYVSHRMDEIFKIADRITVFRDGMNVGTKKVSDTNYDEIVSMMVGRQLEELYPHRDYIPDVEVLRVENLRGKNLKGLSFKLRKGEILGVAGLLGAGNIEVPKLIFGALKKESGKIFINGIETDTHHPHISLKSKIGFVPEDRKEEGLVLVHSVKDNIVMAALDSIVKKIKIDSKLEKEIVDRNIESMNIKVSGINQPVQNLSGGNQQKVVIGKMLEAKPDIFLLSEPTRGVDVGAKSEIYRIMDNLTKSGKSILLITTDIPELVGMSDRIIVLKDGELVIELQKDRINQETVLSYASGGIEHA